MSCDDYCFGYEHALLSLYKGNLRENASDGGVIYAKMIKDDIDNEK